MQAIETVDARMRSLGEVIEPDVRRLVSERLGVGPEDLAPEISLVDELAADSLDVVELGMALEAEWSIIIPSDTLQTVRTYADVVDVVAAALLRSRFSARPAPRARRPAA